jgi:hypothetical protein
MSQGIRISKSGVDATKVLTEANKKDFVFLSDENSPKVYYAGFLQEASPGLNMVEYTHNLGYVPMFFLFATDSLTPTFYRAAGSVASATTTKIEGGFMNYAYLIILKEGKA